MTPRFSRSLQQTISPAGRQVLDEPDCSAHRVSFSDLNQACHASVFAIVPANLASPERTTLAISSLARMPEASSLIPKSGTSMQASEATRADIVVSVSVSDACCKRIPPLSSSASPWTSKDTPAGAVADALAVGYGSGAIFGAAREAHFRITQSMNGWPLSSLWKLKRPHYQICRNIVTTSDCKIPEGCKKLHFLSSVNAS